jgi:hypothetical protein
MVWALSGVASAQDDRAAAPIQSRSYVWYGQFVALDESTRDATFKARIPDHVEKYADQFKPGDRLVLVWNMIGRTEADRVLALWKQEDKNLPDSGYILPVEFVSVDVPSHTVTVDARVPAAVLKSLRSVQAGQWFKAVSPMAQPTREAAITAIEHVGQPPAV